MTFLASFFAGIGFIAFMGAICLFVALLIYKATGGGE